MISRLFTKISDWLEKWIGPNWRTTISGILTILSGFIMTNPEVLDFLPSFISKWIDLFAQIMIFAAGGSFAYFCKDKNVTGGVKPATPEAKLRIQK